MQMLFVTEMKAIPGRYEDAVRKFKHPVIPKGVKVREFLGLFGHLDAIIIFEAPSEDVAVEFVMQFGEMAELCTYCAFPVEKYKWTK